MVDLRLQSLLIALLLPHAFAVEWKTVNFNDPNTAIQFSGPWNSVAPIPGTNTTCDIWTQGPGASATFQFIGTSIRVIGYIPYQINAISAVVDGSPLVAVNDSNAGPANCANVMFQRGGLANKKHEIVVTFNGPFIVPAPPGSQTQSFANSLVIRGFSYAHPIPPNIVGAIAGGATGGTGIMGLIIYLNAHLSYLLHALAYALFGWFGYEARQMIFIADPSLGPTQITLFLSDKLLADPDKDSQERPVAWKVFNIGGANRKFDLSFLCDKGSGVPRLAFGTVDDKGDNIEVVNLVTSAARLVEDTQWEVDSDNEVDPAPGIDGDKKAVLPPHAFMVRNESGHNARLALGTFDGENDKADPFVLFEEFKMGEDHVSRPDLYLHAFRTNGYFEGLYKQTLISDVVGDRLTPDEGLRVQNLSPLTTWLLKPARDGRLRLVVGTNSRQDVKRYQHQFKIKNGAYEKEAAEKA